MAHIVVGAPSRATRLHGQHRLGAIQRLDLGFLIDTEHDGVLGGARYNPTMSRTLATSSGSVENLNVSSRHGCTP